MQLKTETEFQDLMDQEGVRILASGQSSCKNKWIHVWLETGQLILTVCLNVKMLNSLRRWSGSVPGRDYCEVLTARDRGGSQGPAVLFPVLLHQWLQGCSLQMEHCILLGASCQEHCSGDHKRHFPPIPLCEIPCHIPLPQFLTKGKKISSSPSSLPGCKAEL